MNKKRLFILVMLAILIAFIGLSVVNGATDITAPVVRYIPKEIHELDGEPAGCAGQPGCGVMCFYVAETIDDNQWELSCLPWLFDEPANYLPVITQEGGY